MPFPKTKQELEAAGYKFLEEKECSGPTCNAKLSIYLTPKGKKMPLEIGSLEPHFGNCPDLARFRK